MGPAGQRGGREKALEGLGAAPWAAPSLHSPCSSSKPAVLPVPPVPGDVSSAPVVASRRAHKGRFQRSFLIWVVPFLISPLVAGLPWDAHGFFPQKTLPRRCGGDSGHCCPFSPRPQLCSRVLGSAKLCRTPRVGRALPRAQHALTITCLCLGTVLLR